MLHEVATRLRDRTGRARRADDREGGKPLIENTDEIDWTAAAFDYYAEIGRDSAGRVIPSIESSQLALVVKEPVGVARLHRALELPAPAARVEARPGARRRQRDGLQAVRADAALDPGAGALLRAPAAPASSTCSPAPATSARRSSATSGSPASPSPARSRPARRSRPPAPSASRGSTSRWAARTRSSSAPTSPPARRRRPRRRLGLLPQRRPGLHLGGALLRDRRRLRRLRRRLRGVHRVASGRRPDRPADRRRADGLRRPAREGRRPARGGRRRRRRGRRRRRRRGPASAATSSPPRSSPARPPRPTC